MAAFLDDMPLVAGVNENCDDINTYEQVKRPDSDISPITMKTMHHLPQIFFDTLRSERPDCPVLIPNTFSMARDRLIAHSPCGLPTGDFMPAETGTDSPHDWQSSYASRAYTRPGSGHARTGLLS